MSSPACFSILTLNVGSFRSGFSQIISWAKAPFFLSNLVAHKGRCNKSLNRVAYKDYEQSGKTAKKETREYSDVTVLLF
jgi:hypothetical protein